MSETDHTELSRTSVGDFLKLMGSELERTSAFLAKAAGPSLAAPALAASPAPVPAPQLRAAPELEATCWCEPPSAAAVAAPNVGPATGATALSSCREEVPPTGPAAPAWSPPLPPAPTTDEQAVVNLVALCEPGAPALQCPTNSDSSSPAEVAASRSASFVRFQQQQQPQQWEAGPLVPASSMLSGQSQLAQAVPMPPLDEMEMSRTTASSALSSSTCSLSTAVCDGNAAGGSEFARLLQLLAPGCDPGAGVPSGGAVDAPGQLGSALAEGPLDLLAPAAQEPNAHQATAGQPKEPTSLLSALPSSPPILPEVPGLAGKQILPTSSAGGVACTAAVPGAGVKPGGSQGAQPPCSKSGPQQLQGWAGVLHPERQAGATAPPGTAGPEQTQHKSRLKVLRWLRHSEGAQDCSPSQVPTGSHPGPHLFHHQQQPSSAPIPGNAWSPPLAHAVVRPAPTATPHWPHPQPRVMLAGLSAAAAAPLGASEQEGVGRQGTSNAHLPGSRCAADRMDYCDQVANMAPRQRSCSLVRLSGGPGNSTSAKIASSPLKLLKPKALPGGALQRRLSSTVLDEAGACAATATVPEHRAGGLTESHWAALQLHGGPQEQTLHVQQPSVEWNAPPGIRIGSIHTAYFGGPAASGGSAGPTCQPYNPQPLQLQPGAAAQPGSQPGHAGATGVAGRAGTNSPARTGSSGCAAGPDMWGAYLASRRVVQRQQDELQNVDPADAIGTLRQLSSRIKHMQGEITTFLVGSRQPLLLPDQLQEQRLLGRPSELSSGGKASATGEVGVAHKKQPITHDGMLQPPSGTNLAAFNGSNSIECMPLQKHSLAAAAAAVAATGGLCCTQHSNGSGGAAATQSGGSRPGSATSNRSVRSGRSGAIDRLKGLASLWGRNSGERVYYDNSIPVVRIGSSRAK